MLTIRNIYRFSLLLLLLNLGSCRSSEELIYLKNMPEGQKTNRLADSITEHLIKPGDVLYISIKSISPEINTVFNPEEGMDRQSSVSYQKFTTPAGAFLYGYEVNTDGAITLPMLGKIEVTGMPQQKIQELVQQKADVLISDAIVKVKLLNFKVSVLGEVKNPGVYYNYNNTFTIFEALAMANGNTDYASINKVMVVRPGVDGNTSHILDLTSSDSYLSEAFYLQPNDNIFVQPDKNKNFQLNNQPYSMFVSSISLLLAVLVFTLK